jgi:hypothetical protein
MCEYKSYVNSYKHYKVTLWTAYDKVKGKKKPCDYSSSLEDLSITEGLCYLDGCDKKLSSKREGLSKLF